MNLEIAKYILSSYHSLFEAHMEMILEEIEENPTEWEDVDVEDIVWGKSHSQLEDLIYDDLEFEFDYLPDLSLDELIHLAEETVTQM